MDYANYYITTVILILHCDVVRSITTRGGSGGDSSIPRDFKRHIGLAPETNWEPGLREAVHQSLLKEHVSLDHLRQRILQAPMTGHGAKVSPFGDVAILARGQLFANPTGFRFVQDAHQNDCLDCHELRQCYAHECEMYLRNALGERLIALWTVKRLRHRHPDVHYELEYSVAPIRRHVWVTKSGGYDYTIPGHVFVVKTGYGLTHNHHKQTPHKPGGWIPPTASKPPNYYLPQQPKPVDQTASTSLKGPQATSDYAEIDAYKHLLQVLHDHTSTTTKQKFTPMKVTMVTPLAQTTTLSTKPPLSHTTWLVPSTKPTVTSSTTSAPSLTSKAVETTKSPMTTKLAEQPTSSLDSSILQTPSTRISTVTKPALMPITQSQTSGVSMATFTRPGTMPTSPDTPILPTYGTSAMTRPSTISSTTTTIRQSTRPQIIYQQLGGFDTQPSPPAMTTSPTAVKPTLLETERVPVRTTTEMTRRPMQSSQTSGYKMKQTSESIEPMTMNIPTRGRPIPTRTMPPIFRPRPTKTTRPYPTDRQTTPTFLLPTKVTPPFRGGTTKPVIYPVVTRTQSTISTSHKIPVSTSHTDAKTTVYSYKTTIPTRYPGVLAGTTIPGSTSSSSIGAGSIPVRTTLPVRMMPISGTLNPFKTSEAYTTLQYPGTEAGTTTNNFGTSVNYQTIHEYPSNHTEGPTTSEYLPSTTSEYTYPATYTERATTLEGERTAQTDTSYGTTVQRGTEILPIKPTDLGKTSQVSSAQSPALPTFFIDSTHPGYPKTTPITPFTDGQAFKPSPPDRLHHSQPPLVKPATMYLPPTKATTQTTVTKPTDAVRNTSSITVQTGSSAATTYLTPASTSKHTRPTSLPKPSSKAPLAQEAEDVDLFPREPSEMRTTTTMKPSPQPSGDFILPEENYKPQVLIPELNQEDVNVFDRLMPTSSTPAAPTSTINPSEIDALFDSTPRKPKPPTNEKDFDTFFTQFLPTTTQATPAAKVIFSDFFESSALPATNVLETFTSVPSTSQSFSTSVSIKVNSRNKSEHVSIQNKEKLAKFKFRKARVNPLPPSNDSDREDKLVEAIQEQPQKQPQQKEQYQKKDISREGQRADGAAEPRKFGPNGRKYKPKKQNTKKLKTAASSGTSVTKTFDDFALQLVNHARSIDYLEGRTNDERSNTVNGSSIAHLQNRNKYRRKSLGRVRKVKKKTTNKGVITRTNNIATKEPHVDSKPPQ